MLRRLATAAVLAASATSSHAAVVEFRGALCITNAPPACTADGWNVGDCFLMRYSPPNLGTNGPGTELTLLGQTFADNYSIATGTLVGTTPVNAAGVHIGRTAYSFTAPTRISSQSPKVPTDTSATITIGGTIGNFGGTTGCTAAFKGTGVNRP